VKKYNNRKLCLNGGDRVFYTEVVLKALAA
jgi:hypothetical protein